MSKEYDALARVYDEMMSYVPYQQWVDTIQYVEAEYLAGESPTIFELGAGTGSLGALLTYAGYNYRGSDLSEGMCQVAWAKGLDMICADCRNLPLLEPVDLVIFLFDGINYLTTLEEYGITFNQVAHILRPGGLFLFDITTEYNSIHNFDDYHEAESFENGAYIRHSNYDASRHLQVNDFDIFVRFEENPTLFKRIHEQHCQTLFTPAQILAQVPDEIFEVVGVWDGFGHQPAHANSERVHFLLRRCDV